MDTSLLKLVNPEFDIEFMGKVYHLKKASLRKTMEYQIRAGELKNDPGSDAKLIAYAFYIMLKDQIPDLTEEIALDNVPGDSDAIEILVTLGFLSPSKIATAKALKDKFLGISTSEPSSPR
jgi:hypothetical protein